MVREVPRCTRPRRQPLRLVGSWLWSCSSSPRSSVRRAGARSCYACFRCIVAADDAAVRADVPPAGGGSRLSRPAPRAAPGIALPRRAAASRTVDAHRSGGDQPSRDARGLHVDAQDRTRLRLRSRRVRGGAAAPAVDPARRSVGRVETRGQQQRRVNARSASRSQRTDDNAASTDVPARSVHGDGRRATRRISSWSCQGQHLRVVSCTRRSG